MDVIISRLLKPTTVTKVIYIILLFFFISIILMTMIYIQGRVFDGVRSYVRGEGLWAKAQKDAVLYLDRYTFTHDFDDYKAFGEAIVVNLGDRDARDAMDKIPLDRQGAIDGFIAGQNASEDIDSMIWFYRNFQKISYLKEAIDIWRKADKDIDSLIELSSEIHEKVISNDMTDMDKTRTKLHTINTRLLILENRFSQVLGEGARWVKETVLIASLLIFFLFASVSIWVSRQIIGSISRAETSLRISESRFRSLSQSNTIGIMSWTLEGEIVDANDYFLNMLGYTKKDLELGRVNWREMTPSQWNDIDALAIEQLLDMGRCEPYEKELYNASGGNVPVYLGASFVGDHRDRGIAFFVDLTDKKQQEEQLKLAAAVFDVSHDGIIITDDAFNTISVNRALTEILGYSTQEMLGDIPPVLQANPEMQNIINDELHKNGFWQGDMIDHTKDHLNLPVHVSINSVKNSQGRITHYVFIFFDITESKAREEHLEHLAHHDILTGLSNRAHLEKKLDIAIEKASQENGNFALLFFDLDKFKPINDTYGHLVGDKLLKIVARRLTRHIRKSDTVVRLGGDEFIILLESLDNMERAQEICDKTLQYLCTPAMIDGKTIDVSSSAGISIYPQDGADAKTLIEKADINMYTHKKHYR